MEANYWPNPVANFVYDAWKQFAWQITRRVAVNVKDAGLQIEAKTSSFHGRGGVPFAQSAAASLGPAIAAVLPLLQGSKKLENIIEKSVEQRWNVLAFKCTCPKCYLVLTK